MLYQRISVFNIYAPRITTLVLAFLLLFVRQTCLADEVFQTPEKDTFLKTVYTTDNGLPQNSPNNLIQTKDGYIWIATFGGLARFDGVRFTVFTTTNVPELNSNRLTALYEDADGVLWIGSEEGDLATYQNGVFKLIKKSNGPPIDNTILSIFKDENNVVWIGTAHGLKTLNIQTGQFIDIVENTILKSNPDNGEPLRILEFTKDSDGNLWMTSNAGLIRFRDGHFTNFNTSDGLPGNSIISIKNNPIGGLWVLTRNTFGKFKDGKFSVYYKSLITDSNSPLIVNSENHSFFTINKILCEFDENGSKVAEHDLSDVMKSQLRSMLFNSTGDLLLGGDDGLIQLKKRFIKVFSSIAQRQQWEPTNAIIEDSDKTVWIACLGKLLRWKNGNFDKVNITGPNIPNDEIVNSLAADSDGTLWIGTINGIIKFKDNKFSKINDSSINSSVGALFINNQGLWIGSKTNGLQLQLGNDFVKNYTTQESLINNSISYIMQSQTGTLWIGTKDGISRLENGTSTIESSDNILANNYVRDIYEAPNGAFWIGTYGKGIFRVKNGNIVSITSKDGLAENVASRILVDDNDNFWILGNQGIYSVSHQLLDDFADGKISRVYCSVYGKTDGMEVSEGNGGNQPAGWKTSDGKLWFPMIRGGIIIDPNKYKSAPPPVYIEEVLLNKQKVDVTKKIEIQPDQNNLEIDYTGINFTKPEQIQFRYKLDGYDKDWQEVGTRRIAYYAYLPPGNYTFKVLAINTDGIVSKNEASLEIVVHAPFWRTWWFYSLIFLLLILLIIIAYQRRLWRLQRKRVRQEEFSRQLINAHETERHRIAGELHDSLGQNLLIIKNWSLLVLKQLPPKSKYRKQLEEISEFASRTLDETRTIARNLRPQHLQRFGLTETLRNMIKQIEESTAIRFETEIEDIDNYFTGEEELSIYRIVQESLNNVVKHSKAKNAAVKVTYLPGKIEFTNAQDKIEILISDDGNGFNAKAKDKLSFGLDNIIQRAELLGGKYSIRSDIGKGTQITVSLFVKEKKISSGA